MQFGRLWQAGSYQSFSPLQSSSIPLSQISRAPHTTPPPVPPVIRPPVPPTPPPPLPPVARPPVPPTPPPPVPPVVRPPVPPVSRPPVPPTPLPPVPPVSRPPVPPTPLPPVPPASRPPVPPTPLPPVPPVKPPPIPPVGRPPVPPVSRPPVPPVNPPPAPPTRPPPVPPADLPPMPPMAPPCGPDEPASPPVPDWHSGSVSGQSPTGSMDDRKQPPASMARPKRLAAKVSFDDCRIRRLATRDCTVCFLGAYLPSKPQPCHASMVCSTLCSAPTADSELLPICPRWPDRTHPRPWPHCPMFVSSSDSRKKPAGRRRCASAEAR